MNLQLDLAHQQSFQGLEGVEMGYRTIYIALCCCLTVGCASGTTRQVPLPSQLQPAADGAVQPDAGDPDLGQASWIEGGAPAVDGAPEPDAGEPPTTKPPPTVPTAPFAFDFEKSKGPLTGNRDWQWGKLAFSAGPGCWLGVAYPPKQAHSGSHLWGTVLNDCYTARGNGAAPCANNDPADDSILKLSFKIPASFKSAWLVFWEWRDAFSNADWTETWVDGKRVQRRCIAPALPSQWVRRQVELSQQIGKQVTVELHFIASAVGNRAGWYVDDLSVTEKLPAP